MQARIISVANPTAQSGINPGCTDYRHSKFVRRRKYVETVLAPQIAALLPCELFRAVTDADFIVVRLNRPVVLYGESRIRIGAGNTGNFLSHLCLWRQTVEAPTLILEDDAELPPANAENVMEALARFADVAEPAVLHLLSAMPYRETGTKDFPETAPAYGLRRVLKASDLSGTAAYAVNPAGAAALYRAALKYGTLPTDGFIHRAFERGEVAVFVPEKHRENFFLYQHWASWNHSHVGLPDIDPC